VNKIQWCLIRCITEGVSPIILNAYLYCFPTVYVYMVRCIIFSSPNVHHHTFLKCCFKGWFWRSSIALGASDAKNTLNFLILYIEQDLFSHRRWNGLIIQSLSPSFLRAYSALIVRCVIGLLCSDWSDEPGCCN